MIFFRALNELFKNNIWVLGKIVPQSEREGNYCLNPTPNSGQVPPDDDHQVQDDESSQVGSAGLVQYAC